MVGDSAPRAPTDRDAITHRSVFVAQVEPLVDRAHDVAHGIVGDVDVAADVVRDVFDSLGAGPAHALSSGGSRLESVLLATRAAALRHAPSTGSTPTGSTPTDAAPTDTTSSDAQRVPTASRNRIRLTQAAAVALGADDTSTLDLHLRHGVGADALAGVLGVSAADAPRRLDQLRALLDDTLAAFTLWRGGNPACRDLAAALDDGTTLDPVPFDVVALHVVGAHRATCEACARLHAALANPAGMLIAAPVVAVPAALRTRMLPTPAAPPSELLGPHRRSADDTPTALLWAPVDRPERTPTPVTDAHRGGRWPVIAASAAALLLVVAGGVALAVRGPTNDDRPATTAAATPTDDPTDATEVRSLGPLPPVVATDGVTSTSSPDTTVPTNSEPGSTAPHDTTESSDPGDTRPVVAATPSVATTVRPRAPQGPAPRVAVTTAGPTTTAANVSTGIPPLPPPPTTATTTTTTTTTTTPTPTVTTTTTAASTTVAGPEPTTPEPTTPGPTVGP